MDSWRSAAATDPGLVRACGADPGEVCRFVFDHTSSRTTAKVADFLVDRPLKILLILAVAWALNRIVRRIINRSVARIARLEQSDRLAAALDRAPDAVSSHLQPNVRSAARAKTIGQVLRSLSTVVIYTFAAMYVVAELGLQLGPLIAGAGIAGVAIGFGAQSLVKDFLSGMFMLVEDQYGVGDVVDCGIASGTVEAVTLRTTRLRDVNGTVWHVPNGEIQRVGNKSQQWARAVLDVLVGTGTDVGQAEALLLDAATRASEDPGLAADVIEPPEVWGVEKLGPEGITLRLVVKTHPGSQFKVLRSIREAVHGALAAGGVQVPASPGTITVVGTDDAATGPADQR